MSTGHSFVASGNMENRGHRKETAGPGALPSPVQVTQLLGYGEVHPPDCPMGFQTEHSTEKVQEVAEAKHGERFYVTSLFSFLGGNI